MLKTIICVLILILFSMIGFGQTACPKPVSLENFGCVRTNIYRGSQPNPEGIKELARLGVKTVVSLRDNNSKTRSEKELAEKEGMKFINIPFSNWFAPNDANVQKALSAIGDAGNQTVFVHCKRGADRTGTLVAIYRISRNGWTATEAKKEAKTFSFGWWQIWMNNYIDDFYRDFLRSRSGLPS